MVFRPSLFRPSAFSLIELLVAMVITSVLVVMLVNIGSTASTAWLSGAAKSESFSAARGALALLNSDMQTYVCDLDIGFRIDSKDGAGLPNNSITFLKRRQPDLKENSAAGDDKFSTVEKVRYELAWTSRDLDEEGDQKAFSFNYDGESTPIPVLVRSSSQKVTDVFEVNSAGDLDNWIEDWHPTDSGKGSGNRTQVLADNVLGWQIEPIYYDESAHKLRQLTPTDDTVTVNKESVQAFDQYLLGPVSPVALKIRLATIPSRDADRIEKAFPGEWGTVRSKTELFDKMSTWPDSSFFNLLRRSLRLFETTIYLKPQTP